MVILPSYAKLNLNLHIYKPLANGYHPIQSVFQTISLSDTLHITPLESKGVDLICSNPFLTIDSSNSILKVYHWAAPQLPVGFDIRLEKRIPMGAGLGGGSANAATFLRFLNDHYLNLVESDLLEASVQFGADVPFFIKGGRALVSGIGEQLESLSNMSPLHYVLLYPNCHANTAHVYHEFGRLAMFRSSFSTEEEIINSVNNDLLAPAVSLYPQLTAILEWSSSQSRTAPLTGSGATFFWIFDHKEAADDWVSILNEQYPDFLIFQATNIDS